MCNLKKKNAQTQNAKNHLHIAPITLQKLKKIL